MQPHSDVRNNATAAPTATDSSLAERVRAVPFWFHSIELGRGFTTPGFKQPAQLAAELSAYRLPDLNGKSVLDVGAWDGYFSFAAERLGAARVVALDHFMWAIDAAGLTEYANRLRERGQLPPRYDQTPYWRPTELPGKQGFDLAHEVLGSRVEPVVGDFMETDLSRIGTFDVVLYLGVLYHMEDPMRSLRRLVRVVKPGGLAVIETQAMEIPNVGRNVGLCRYLAPGELNRDVSNWWVPNARALRLMCERAGFSRVEILNPPPGPRRRPRALARRLARKAGLRPNTPDQYRLAAHAIR